ncbi:unnamed protein product [Musa banksii]
MEESRERQVMALEWEWNSIWQLFAALVFLRTAYRDFLPPELHHFVGFLLRGLMTRFDTDLKIIVDEYDGSCSNELYSAAQAYLGSHCLDDARVVRIPLRWSSVVERASASSSPIRSSSLSSDHRYLELSFHSRHREAVRSQYIPHVLAEAGASSGPGRRLYTNRSVVLAATTVTPVPAPLLPPLHLRHPSPSTRFSATTSSGSSASGTITPTSPLENRSLRSRTVNPRTVV